MKRIRGRKPPDLRSYGASNRTRTDDPRFTRAVLYQLSYAGASPVRTPAAVNSTWKPPPTQDVFRAIRRTGAALTRQAPPLAHRGHTSAFHMAARRKGFADMRRAPPQSRETHRRCNGFSTSARGHLLKLLACAWVRRQVHLTGNIGRPTSARAHQACGVQDLGPRAAELKLTCTVRRDPRKPSHRDRSRTCSRCSGRSAPAESTADRPRSMQPAPGRT